MEYSTIFIYIIWNIQYYSDSSETENGRDIKGKHKINMAPPKEISPNIFLKMLLIDGLNILINELV